MFPSRSLRLPPQGALLLSPALLALACACAQSGEEGLRHLDPSHPSEGSADQDAGVDIDGSAFNPTVPTAPTTPTTPAEPTAPADPRPSAGLVWPNAQSSANSDPWLAAHHDEITEMHPRALILDFANRVPADQVMDRWKLMAQAFAEGSTYHAYGDPQAKPFVIHELLKFVDLSDDTSGVNAAGMPRKNGGIDFAQLYTQAFADKIGVADPKHPGHNLTLCEMLQQGVMHELFIAFNKTAPDDNVPEVIEFKQKYDENDKPLPGQFAPFAGNGAFDPPLLPEAVACGRSLRVDFIEMTGNISGALHVLSHNLEHLGDEALPSFKKQFFPLLNRDFDVRFHTPFSDWYGISVNGTGSQYLFYTSDNSVRWTCPQGTPCAAIRGGDMNPLNEGCGNTHYAPNSRNSYDMANMEPVLTRCEHYGLRDGPGAKDIQTPYTAATVAKLAAKYGSDGNGGGWQIYLFQSLPGFKTRAVTAEGKKIHNFWPYLYY